MDLWDADVDFQLISVSIAEDLAHTAGVVVEVKLSSKFGTRMQARSLADAEASVNLPEDVVAGRQAGRQGR